MAKKFAKSFYNSIQWKRTQELYRQTRYGICERCGKPNGTIVHHKIYLDETNITNPMISLNFDNLELLCQECHNAEHHSKYKPTMSGLKFNANGELEKL